MAESTNNTSHLLNITPGIGSIEEGKKLFSTLMKPMEIGTFFDHNWEKKAVLLDRRPGFYAGLVSTDIIMEKLHHNHVNFTESIDIHFREGVEAVAPVGRAVPGALRQYYDDGCVIQFMNPQTFLPTIHDFIARLQEFFHCMVESNIYLSTTNADGHAPRYDDVEMFVLQIEGEKCWRVYDPFYRSNMLPSDSGNADPIGLPVVEAILKEGDLLYVPRGFLHETNTPADGHSLHLTVSTCRKQTFGDLLEVLLPIGLKRAINSSTIPRRGLPVDIWQTMGAAAANRNRGRRTAVVTQIEDCLQTVRQYSCHDQTLDNAVDRMAVRYQRDSLPPFLTQKEQLRCAQTSRIRLGEDGCLKYLSINLDSKIRLIRHNAVRMVLHDNVCRLYYNLNNSISRKPLAERFLEFDSTHAPAIQSLIKSYPAFISSNDIQLELVVAQNLWQQGILMTDEPLTERSEAGPSTSSKR